MNDSVGPVFEVNPTTRSFEGLSFVDEILPVVDDLHGVMNYLPFQAETVLVFVDGLKQSRFLHYLIKDRLIEFASALTVGAVVSVQYITEAIVADVPADEIAFAVVSGVSRVNNIGTSQVMGSDNLWHDLVPVTNPVTGELAYVVDQDPSTVQ